MTTPNLKEQEHLRELISGATPKERKRLHRLMCTATPAHFAYHCSGGLWQPHKHLLLVQDALLKVARGEIKRLQISMPPQHGKSEFSSHYFPAWLLGTRPDTRILLASYESENAEIWGQKVRDTLEEFGGLFGVEVDPRQAAKHYWRIHKRRGRMISLGVGGPGTGKDCDIAIIDDPVKDDADAQSFAQREKKKQWYIKVLERRLSGGAIILIMTRWHDDDLAGWLYNLNLAGQGESWTRIILPAICPDPSDITESARLYYGEDPLGRKPGEALWPEKHPLQEFKDWRAKDEPSFWALGQQFPFIATGGMFKLEWLSRFWDPAKHPLEMDEKMVWRYKRNASQFEQMAMSCDFTFGSNKGISFCVLQVWARRGGDFLLLHQVREKLEYVGMIQAFLEILRQFPMIGPKLVEAKAAGPYVMRLLKEKVNGIVPIDAKDSKPTRASGTTYIYEAGNVLLPPQDLYPWVRGFISEHLAFPRGATDDQVDGGSQYLAWCTKPQVKTHDNKPRGF